MIIKSLTSLGLYGEASLNSIELALLISDGLDVQKLIKSATVPYPENLIVALRKLVAQRNWSFAELEENTKVQQVREDISDFYSECIIDFCKNEETDCIGVDGLTVFNDPQNKCSYQLEDGRKITNNLKKTVITHFRKADLLSGGQSSPLSPPFFNFIGQTLPKPLLFIDVEAVSSIIYIGESGEIKAFDCSPGVAMIEDWTFRHANMQTDYNGKLAALGKVHSQIVNSMLKHKALHKIPPKSLDILEFSDKKEHLEGLSLEDGAATAVNFIAEAIYQSALDFLPAIPQNIFIGGEGTKNPSLLRSIKQNFAPRKVVSLTEINPRLTAVGAQTAAFNTVRRIYGLPITYPNTTGAYEPMTGGEIYEYTNHA
ncbi:MAG: anhydro-N-acetylmuramic acid kinase [Alphaproteobacteria bacterium]|nr:anhydro-N-acetylmuramic acid kinase [Alphaproteobacteria bacterium]